MSKSKSEIAAFREQQALSEQAATHGLSGLASVANHASITARMKHEAEHILHLIQTGQHQQAQVLLETEAWQEPKGGLK